MDLNNLRRKEKVLAKCAQNWTILHELSIWHNLKFILIWSRNTWMDPITTDMYFISHEITHGKPGKKKMGNMLGMGQKELM